MFIVDKRIVGRGVDAAISAVAISLGRDESEIVGRLEIVPILHETLVAGNAHTIGHRIEFVERLLLHGIAEPRRKVALFVDPRGGIFDIEGSDGRHLVADFGRRGKSDAALAELFGERLEKLEDVARQGLEHAEGAEFHEDVDHLLVFGRRRNPIGEGFGKEGIFAPRRVVEAVGDIFRQGGVAEQKFEVGIAAAMVDKMRRLPSEAVFCAFG